MRVFLSWLWACRSKSAFIWQMTLLEKKIRALQADKDRWDRTLDSRKEALSAVALRFERELKHANRQIDEVTLFNKKLEEGLEATREQLRTAEEITIPALVAAHDVLLKRWHAESMIMSIREVAHSKDTD